MMKHLKAIVNDVQLPNIPKNALPQYESIMIMLFSQSLLGFIVAPFESVCAACLSFTVPLLSRLPVINVDERMEVAGSDVDFGRP